jgi:hypothetical protein
MPKRRPQRFHLAIRPAGMRLVRSLQDRRAAGTQHVSPNLSSERPVRDVLEEIAARVLPEFHESA